MSFYKLVMLMKAEKKRQDIINAAMELFKEHGFDQVSVDDICERLDISKPTLYKYISKKEMILSYYYQQHSVDSLPSTYILLDQNRPAAALHNLFNTLHETVNTMGPDLFAAYRAYALSDHSYLASHSRPQVEVLERCLKELQEQDFISAKASPHKLAVMLMDLNEGLCISWAARKGDFDLSKTFQHYVRIMLGVKKGPNKDFTLEVGLDKPIGP